MSNESNTAGRSRAVVPRAARPETIFRVREDIPLVMFVLRWLLLPLNLEAVWMIAQISRPFRQLPDTTSEMAPGRAIRHDPRAS